MDPALSTIIVAIITGIFTVVITVVQKRQDAVIKKIDQQTAFIEQEKELKEELLSKEKECEMVVHQIMVLILNTNLSILKNTQIGDNSSIDDSAFDEADDLISRFKTTQAEIDQINARYDMLIEIKRRESEGIDKKD